MPIDFSTIRNYAPKPPKYKARFQAIQLETIAGSKEMLTVLVVAQSDTEFKVIQAISPQTIECMFNDYAKDYQHFINTIHQDLEAHLAQDHPLEKWQAPITGIQKSLIQETRSQNIEGVIFQALTNYSSLNNGQIIQDAKDYFFDTEPKQASALDKKLILNIKDIVSHKIKRLSKNFNQTIRLSNGVNISLDYIGEHYNAGVANFTIANPKQAIKNSKIKLYDLETLREDNKLNISTQQFELLTYLPNTATEQSKDGVEELILSADKKDLRVRKMPTPASIAEIIINNEKQVA